jgi:hypothetical protein
MAKGGPVAGTPRPRRRTAPPRTQNRQNPPKRELGALLLPIFLATLALATIATKHCGFDSGEVRTRRETGASEENGRKWVVYLKRPRDDPSAPTRIVNSC